MKKTKDQRIKNKNLFLTLEVFKYVFLSLVFILFSFSPALAGTDLTVTCLNQGPCDISPASTPLFDETSILPGDTFTQDLTIRNFDVDDTCNLVLNVTDTTGETDINLAERIFASINNGSTDIIGTTSSGEAQPGFTYQNLYDTSNISLGSLAPLQSRVYTWNAQFDFDAGNEYQLSQTEFAFDIDISCSGGSTSKTKTTSSSSDSRSSSGSTTTPSAPQCDNPNMFSEAPGLCGIIGQSDNSVTLNWQAVSGASAYGIIFTDDQGGTYSALPSYVGNNTTYTINNLNGGRTYSFEIFAVGGNENLCASPRCSASVLATGGEVRGRPIGQGGQTLGLATDAESSPSPSPESRDELTGDVKGASTCTTWKWYIPWILLLAQGFFILAVDYYLKKDERYTKQYAAVGITLVSIVIFYLIRECQCYDGVWWFLAWLCKWYWLVSILLSSIIQAINYAFIEETQVVNKEEQLKS